MATARLDRSGIRAKGMVRLFSNGFRAVDGVDLKIRPGSVFGLLGPNGAGKSTIVLMLTTLVPLTSGRARVGGFDVTRHPAQVRQVIGAALQEVALDPLLTGREHVRLQSSLHGLPRESRQRRSDELLERFGLSAAADRRVGHYSGGMKRRLDLALALVHRPSILFLDEPTTGLDLPSRTALWEEIRTLAHHDGATVLLTTQYLEEADLLADRIAILDRGKIIAEGTPASLKGEVGKPRVEVVPSSDADAAKLARVLARFGRPTVASPGAVAVRLANGQHGLPDVVRALDSEGLQFSHLEHQQPTLDDVFLAKTGRSLEGSSPLPHGVPSTVLHRQPNVAVRLIREEFGR